MSNQTPSPGLSGGFSRAISFFSGLLMALIAVPMITEAAELEDARKLLREGKYAECEKVTKAAIDDNEYDEEWRALNGRALLAQGKYPEALEMITKSVPRYYSSVRLRLLSWEIHRANGQGDRAKSMLSEINYLAGSRTYAYRDAQSMITLGRTALLLGADPKRVMDTFYVPLKQQDATNRDVYLAMGDLALEKHDYEMASKEFQRGLQSHPKDADLLYGLAKAYAPSDRKAMVELVNKALAANKNHAEARLLLVDHFIDAEQYEAAKITVDEVLKINPKLPEVWAYQAVLAHLKNNAAEEKRCREEALKLWKNNPKVDHLIGLKLSQKYRFAEGAEFQRQALKFDAEYLPAKAQLAQDYLRIGKTDEGWILADEVHRADEYDVTAYNLTTLKGVLDSYATITNQYFIVRMPAKEGPIFGDRVLELLERARTNLCAKYGLELKQPITVEIFGSQKDFGVRTFGMPDNPGFLGVCFGKVITANSPSAQVSRSANWEAVLWHEFCHVVTLELTRNRMPRWLSEGISVYEERQANPVWGQHMNAQYREMVLGEDLTPVSELSGAFLNAKSGLHVQFAYYQSSLVVEHLVEKYGIEALRKILKDLHEGVGINEAIAKNTQPMEKVEKEFAAYAKKLAEGLAPQLSFRKPDPKSNVPGAEVVDQLIGDPRNYYVLLQKSAALLREKKWAEAKEPLKKLIEAYPRQIGSDSAYYMLATAHRNMKETGEERATLEKLAAIDGEAVDAYLRLMEIGVEQQDWKLVQVNSDRFLAVNPLLAQPYWFAGKSNESTGNPEKAADAYKRLLQLDPADPAEVHYRLAKLLTEKNPVQAKEHVLRALEEAPRFREAHGLLLKLQGTNGVGGEKKAAGFE
ncbi:MAG TPA: tetratricopeptide repeat protein [Verrucomicrobiae bacterium]